jgi:hypothetical protein
MSKTTTPSPIAAFDVRQLPGGNSLLWEVDESARAIITAGAVEILDEHPTRHTKGDLLFLAHRCWEKLRATEFRPGRTIEFALTEMPGGSPLQALREVFEVLMAAGDLEATLRRERDRIDSALEQLAKRRAK